MALDDDQVRELVRRFVAIEMGGWDDAAFGRALEVLGWRAAEYSDEELEWQRRRRRPSGREEYETGLGTGRGVFARHGAGDERSQISVRAGEGEELFRRLRSAIEDELGVPSVMRGPGPSLRWRGKDRLLELEHGRLGVYLELRPLEAVENAEYQVAKWGEAEDGLGPLGYWQVVNWKEGEADLFVPGGYFADGWAEFEERLAKTLVAVVRDFALLGDLGDFVVVVRAPGDRRFVQWYASGPMLWIEAGIPDESDAAWSAAMAESGWLPSDSEGSGKLLVIREFPVLGDEEAATAAHMLVGTLQSYGAAFEDLWYELISPDVHLLGIGLPTRPGGR
ncbi:TY-Chap domain-containing protein [Actinocorallia aurantiaca]|uniref:TY-Chap N-terminal domain-containing protein n=1 Tax=Actinocorallia aurantiaca TaxID=46204 RepID=A0ABN3U7J7_9ACTN